LTKKGGYYMRFVHENVGLIRRACHVTKTDVAKHLGMSTQGYRYLENGKSRLDVERFRKIAELLNIKISVFFDDELTDLTIKNIKLQRINGGG